MAGKKDQQRREVVRLSEQYRTYTRVLVDDLFLFFDMGYLIVYTPGLLGSCLQKILQEAGPGEEKYCY